MVYFEDSMGEKIIRKTVSYFIIALFFLYIILLMNQLLLIRGGIGAKHPSFTNIMLLMLYSLPSTLAIAVPYAVGVGFTQGLLKANIGEQVARAGKTTIIKKIVLPICCLGMTIAVLDFLVIEFVLPGANASFGNLYNAILLDRDGETIVPAIRQPRDMRSREVFQGMEEIKLSSADDYARRINAHRMEIGKRISISLSPLFFALFALALAVFVKKSPLPGMFLSILGCMLYWLVIISGERFSLRQGQFGVLMMGLPNVVLLCLSFILFLNIKKQQA
jgi:lipopolysaccharide export LptBFGC system permease protein LptF